jgi:hypothetical protein
MRATTCWLWPAVLTAALALAPTTTWADVVRYHFTPADLASQTCCPAGVWQPWRGSSRREPYTGQLRPTHLVTFRSPYTGGNVIVPLALPDDTPRVEHVGDRILFNYGGYTVETQFFADGSVDVLYDSGLFRPPWPR